MRFLVISDTHGRIRQAEDVFRKLVCTRPVDRILHLGDYQRDGEALGKRLGVPVTAVKGNMDGSYSEKDFHVLPTEWGNILLTHGHMESVKYSLETLLYKAEALECKAAFFGHTHVPLYREASGIYLLNPGSLSLPRGGRKGSYGVVETAPGELNATILYLGDDNDEKSSTSSNKGNGKDAKGQNPPDESDGGSVTGRSACPNSQCERAGKQSRQTGRENPSVDPGRNGPAEGGRLRDILNHSDRF